ncbi:MAG: RNA polymerase sigma factor [Pyrinomonadaceae bacterium]
MDQLLLPYLEASDESERQECLDDLLMVHAAPVVRQALRRRLGFYVDQRGINPHNQDAEDLYQEIMSKIVQALHELKNPSAKTDIQNLKQYVARIASNACNDVLRTKSPSRARLKNNLRFLLTNHRDFAVWKIDGETLSGFAMWRDTSNSLSSQRELFDIEERLPGFRSTRFRNENIKQVPLATIVAELFEWIGSPVELDALVNVVATLLDVKDHPVESLDDHTLAYVETRIADSTLHSSSRLEEQALLRSLWQALRELSTQQRDVFCFGFEDQAGRDLFTVLLEAEVVTFRELAKELARSTETIVALWSKMPMDDEDIAVEMKTTRAQVYKWRFRALERLRKGLLPFSAEK